MTDIGKLVMGSMSWNHNTRLFLRFFVYLADANIPQNKCSYEFLAGAVQVLCNKNSTLDPSITIEAVEEIRAHHPTLEAFVLLLLSSYTHSYDWSLRADADEQKSLQNEAINLIYQTIVSSGRIRLGVVCNHREFLVVFRFINRRLSRSGGKSLWACEATVFLSAG